MANQPRTLSVQRAASLRSPILMALGVLLVFFVGFGGWAALVPLSGAALAPAYVAPEGFRKTVQHLEGGIISEIRVREGSEVKEGDVIVVLDSARAKADYNRAHAQLTATLAKAARLTAEQDGLPEPQFPPDLVADAAHDPQTQALMEAEQQSMIARRAALADQIAMRNGKIAQAQADLDSSQGTLDALDRQIALIDEEIATVIDLLSKGLDRKPRLLQLQRSRADLEGQRNAAVSHANATRQLIIATQAERAGLQTGRNEQIASDLAEARGAGNQLRAEVQAASDRLERTEIRAPVTGEVVDLKLRNAGGVVSPGEAIMDIVPRDQRLVIEARVSPKDIDVVHAGLKADIHLTAYHTRHVPRIQGEVIQVSADRLTDQKTGEPYYTAQIYVDMAAVNKKAPEVHLSPGMPADAMIITGERTLLQYLTEPIRNSFRRSLRDS